MRIVLWLFGLEILDFRIGGWSEPEEEEEKLEFGFVGSDE